MKNVPKVIYLQVTDDDHETFDDFNKLSDEDMLCWCSDKINDHDIEYIRNSQDNVESKQNVTQQTKPTICPDCGGEVLINKPSGAGFCIDCTYTVPAKQYGNFEWPKTQFTTG